MLLYLITFKDSKNYHYAVKDIQDLFNHNKEFTNWKKFNSIQTIRYPLKFTPDIANNKIMDLTSFIEGKKWTF